ncbi:hypothetical protein [Streptomyces brevispora]|uniref:hypothetical protein n=1 Tax=Streptomyces brevispora TaxID=887462 RepID=UPI00380B433A
MTPFRRPPEWEQPAGRHTELKDPVLTVRQISRLGFVPRRLTRIDHALVFSTASGTYTVSLPPLRPTRAEIISRRYTAVYEVDMGVHPVSMEMLLPSSNDALEFEAVVELTWQVGDPATFVRSGHRDVPRLLLDELEQATRSVVRRFAVTNSADAEAEVLRTLRLQGPLGTCAGLLVAWTMRLHRDRDNIGHQRRMQAIDHAATERIHSEQRAMTYDAEVDRRTRQLDALQAERSLEYGRQQQAMLLQTQAWRTELRNAELSKIDFYQRQLEQGGVRAWAVHLAEHPEDSRLVVQSLREDQMSMIRAKADMVAQLLSGDSTEDYELESPKELALRALHDILNQQLPGDDSGRGAPVPRLPVAEWPPGGTENPADPGSRHLGSELSAQLGAPPIESEPPTRTSSQPRPYPSDPYTPEPYAREPQTSADDVFGAAPRGTRVPNPQQPIQTPLPDVFSERHTTPRRTEEGTGPRHSPAAPPRPLRSPDAPLDDASKPESFR